MSSQSIDNESYPYRLPVFKLDSGDHSQVMINNITIDDDRNNINYNNNSMMFLRYKTFSGVDGNNIDFYDQLNDLSPNVNDGNKSSVESRVESIETRLSKTIARMTSTLKSTSIQLFSNPSSIPSPGINVDRTESTLTSKDVEVGIDKDNEFRITTHSNSPNEVMLKNKSVLESNSFGLLSANGCRLNSFSNLSKPVNDGLFIDPISFGFYHSTFDNDVELNSQLERFRLVLPSNHSVESNFTFDSNLHLNRIPSSIMNSNLDYQSTSIVKPIKSKLTDEFEIEPVNINLIHYLHPYMVDSVFVSDNEFIGKRLINDVDLTNDNIECFGTEFTLDSQNVFSSIDSPLTFEHVQQSSHYEFKSAKFILPSGTFESKLLIDLNSTLDNSQDSSQDSIEINKPLKEDCSIRIRIPNGDLMTLNGELHYTLVKVDENQFEYQSPSHSFSKSYSDLTGLTYGYVDSNQSISEIKLSNDLKNNDNVIRSLKLNYVKSDSIGKQIVLIPTDINHHQFDSTFTNLFKLSLDRQQSNSFSIENFIRLIQVEERSNPFFPPSIVKTSFYCSLDTVDYKLTSMIDQPLQFTSVKSSGCLVSTSLNDVIEFTRYDSKPLTVHRYIFELTSRESESTRVQYKVYSTCEMRIERVKYVLDKQSNSISLYDSTQEYSFNSTLRLVDRLIFNNPYSVSEYYESLDDKSKFKITNQVFDIQLVETKNRDINHSTIQVLINLNPNSFSIDSLNNDLIVNVNSSRFRLMNVSVSECKLKIKSVDYECCRSFKNVLLKSEDHYSKYYTDNSRCKLNLLHRNVDSKNMISTFDIQPQFNESQSPLDKNQIETLIKTVNTKLISRLNYSCSIVKLSLVIQHLIENCSTVDDDSVYENKHVKYSCDDLTLPIKSTKTIESNVKLYNSGECILHNLILNSDGTHALMSFMTSDSLEYIPGLHTLGDFQYTVNGEPYKSTRQIRQVLNEKIIFNDSNSDLTKSTVEVVTDMKKYNYDWTHSFDTNTARSKQFQFDSSNDLMFKSRVDYELYSGYLPPQYFEQQQDIASLMVPVYEIGRNLLQYPIDPNDEFYESSLGIRNITSTDFEVYINFSIPGLIGEVRRIWFSRKVDSMNYNYLLPENHITIPIRYFHSDGENNNTKYIYENYIKPYLDSKPDSYFETFDTFDYNLDSRPNWIEFKASRKFIIANVGTVKNIRLNINNESKNYETIRELMTSVISSSFQPYCDIYSNESSIQCGINIKSCNYVLETPYKFESYKLTSPDEFPNVDSIFNGDISNSDYVSDSTVELKVMKSIIENASHIFLVPTRSTMKVPIRSSTSLKRSIKHLSVESDSDNYNGFGYNNIRLSHSKSSTSICRDDISLEYSSVNNSSTSYLNNGRLILNFDFGLPINKFYFTIPNQRVINNDEVVRLDSGLTFPVEHNLKFNLPLLNGGMETRIDYSTSSDSTSLFEFSNRLSKLKDGRITLMLNDEERIYDFGNGELIPVWDKSKFNIKSRVNCKLVSVKLNNTVYKFDSDFKSDFKSTLTISNLDKYVYEIEVEIILESTDNSGVVMIDFDRSDSDKTGLIQAFTTIGHYSIGEIDSESCRFETYYQQLDGDSNRLVEFNPRQLTEENKTFFKNCVIHNVNPNYISKIHFNHTFSFNQLLQTEFEQITSGSINSIEFSYIPKSIVYQPLLNRVIELYQQMKSTSTSMSSDESIVYGFPLESKLQINVVNVNSNQVVNQLIEESQIKNNNVLQYPIVSVDFGKGSSLLSSPNDCFTTSIDSGLINKSLEKSFDKNKIVKFGIVFNPFKSGSETEIEENNRSIIFLDQCLESCCKSQFKSNGDLIQFGVQAIKSILTYINGITTDNNSSFKYSSDFTTSKNHFDQDVKDKIIRSIYSTNIYVQVDSSDSHSTHTSNNLINWFKQQHTYGQYQLMLIYDTLEYDSFSIDSQESNRVISQESNRVIKSNPLRIWLSNPNLFSFDTLNVYNCRQFVSYPNSLPYDQKLSTQLITPEIVSDNFNCSFTKSRCKVCTNESSCCESTLFDYVFKDDSKKLDYYPRYDSTLDPNHTYTTSPIKSGKMSININRSDKTPIYITTMLPNDQLDSDKLSSQVLNRSMSQLLNGDVLFKDEDGNIVQYNSYSIDGDKITITTNYQSQLESINNTYEYRVMITQLNPFESDHDVKNEINVESNESDQSTIVTYNYSHVNMIQFENRSELNSSISKSEINDDRRLLYPSIPNRKYITFYIPIEINVQKLTEMRKMIVEFKSMVSTFKGLSFTSDNIPSMFNSNVVYFNSQSNQPDQSQSNSNPNQDDNDSNPNQDDNDSNPNQDDNDSNPNQSEKDESQSSTDNILLDTFYIEPGCYKSLDNLIDNINNSIRSTLKKGTGQIDEMTLILSRVCSINLTVPRIITGEDNTSKYNIIVDYSDYDFKNKSIILHNNHKYTIVKSSNDKSKSIELMIGTLQTKDEIDIVLPFMTNLEDNQSNKMSIDQFKFREFYLNNDFNHDYNIPNILKLKFVDVISNNLINDKLFYELIVNNKDFIKHNLIDNSFEIVDNIIPVSFKSEVIPEGIDYLRLIKRHQNFQQNIIDNNESVKTFKLNTVLTTSFKSDSDDSIKFYLNEYFKSENFGLSFKQIPHDIWYRLGITSLIIDKESTPKILGPSNPVEFINSNVLNNFNRIYWYHYLSSNFTETTYLNDNIVLPHDYIVSDKYNRSFKVLENEINLKEHIELFNRMWKPENKPRLNLPIKFSIKATRNKDVEHALNIGNNDTTITDINSYSIDNNNQIVLNINQYVNINGVLYIYIDSQEHYPFVTGSNGVMSVEWIK